MRTHGQLFPTVLERVVVPEEDGVVLMDQRKPMRRWMSFIGTSETECVLLGVESHGSLFG